LVPLRHKQRSRPLVQVWVARDLGSKVVAVPAASATWATRHGMPRALNRPGGTHRCWVFTDFTLANWSPYFTRGDPRFDRSLSKQTRYLSWISCGFVGPPLHSGTDLIFFLACELLTILPWQIPRIWPGGMPEQRQSSPSGVVFGHACTYTSS